MATPKLDPYVESIFSLLSTFVSNIYYSTLYIEAVKRKENGQSISITAGYKHVCNEFLVSVNHKSRRYVPIDYNNLLRQINAYFQLQTDRATQTTSECIGMIVKAFVPTTYFTALTTGDRLMIMKRVLTNFLVNTTHLMTHDYILDVIDGREIKETKDMIRDNLSKLLVVERDDIYQDFVNQQNGVKGNRNIAEVLEMRKRITGLENALTIARREIIEQKTRTSDYESKLKQAIALCKSIRGSGETGMAKITAERDRANVENDRLTDILRQRDERIAQLEAQIENQLMSPSISVLGSDNLGFDNNLDLDPVSAPEPEPEPTPEPVTVTMKPKAKAKPKTKAKPKPKPAPAPVVVETDDNDFGMDMDMSAL